MKRTVRAVVMAVIAGALGLTLAVVPSQFSPEQAHAAVSPNIPPPISLLPSIISGVTGTGAGTAAVTAKAQLIRNAVVLATVAEALGKQTAGLPLVKTEVDLIADAVKKIRFPAFKPAALMKGVGAAALPLVALDAGLSFGNGVVDVLGWNEAGLLCTSGNDFVTGWVSVVNGADCAGYEELTAEAIAAANSDITPGLVAGTACLPSGLCLTVVAIEKFSIGGYIADRWCFTRSDGATGSANATPFWFRNDQMTTWQRRDTVVSTLAQYRCTGMTAGTYSAQYWQPVRYSTTPTEHPPTEWSLVDPSVTPGADISGVTDIAADPERTFECRILGTDAVLYTANSLPWREGDGATSPVICPTLPPGVDPQEWSVWEVGGGEQHELIPTTSTTPEFQAAKTAYPDCSSSVCLLKLHKEGTDCHTVDGLCADWFEDPDKTTKYTCTNGPYAAPLAECTVYKPTFQPGAKVSPAPYGDPTTGEPLPNSAPNPSSLGGPAIDPSQPRECFPSGWAVFNPVEWVMKPVQCALEWAAVPRIEKVVALQNRASSSWNATTLAKSVTALEGIAPVLAGLSDGNCAGVLIDLGGIAPEVLDIAPARFLAACPGDFFSPWAPWVKSFLVLSLTVGGFFSVKSQLSRFTSNGEA